MKKSKKILPFLLIVLSTFFMIIDVNAENIIDDPYIDITFDEIAKENAGHGTLRVFSSNEFGEYAEYGNSNVSYGVNAYGTYMSWVTDKPHGGGFNLDVDKAIGENYTIALKFSFTNTGEIDGGYKKIIDFQKLDYIDSGFYFYDGGKIMFYPKNSLGTAVKNNEVIDLLVRRNASTEEFEVYNRINGVSELYYQFIDDEKLSVLSSGLGFFHDDLAPYVEATDGGKVYSVKIWDSYLDVDDVWESLDREQENSISKYICRKIEKKEPAEVIPGWETYFECKDKTDGSYKYFEDEDLSEVISNIDDWKKDEGYISQTKSFAEIIYDLENKLDNIDESNVKSSNKAKIDEVKDVIDNIVIDKASSDEQLKLNNINKKCKSLIKIINDTESLLKEIEEVVAKYSDKKLTKEDKINIQNILTKTQAVNDNNLTEEEKEKYNLNIQILENLLKVDCSYKFLKGDNQKLVINDIKDYKFTIDGDYSLFESLKIGDLDLIKDEDYVVTEGSTIITFTDKGISKLNTLENGDYQIVVNYSNGKRVKGNLTLNKVNNSNENVEEENNKNNVDVENPKTNDKIMNYIIIGIISLIGLVSFCFLFKGKLLKND